VFLFPGVHGLAYRFVPECPAWSADVPATATIRRIGRNELAGYKASTTEMPVVPFRPALQILAVPANEGLVLER
jgi:hypothetical protein